MTTTVGDQDEVKTAGRLQTDPGDPRLAAEARLGQGRTIVVDVGKGETEVEDRDVEASDAETVPVGGLQAGGTVAQPDDTVESRKDAVKSYGMTRGKLLAD